MPAIYDTIGVGYTKHRCADARIVNAFTALLDLPPHSVIADVGAGTGNYSLAFAERGFLVKAVEPSEVMRCQGRMHDGIEWFDGTAEALPLHDASVHGLVCVLAAHHFVSLGQAIAEMRRVCPNGPIVWLTFDPRLIAPPWFADYFPGIWDQTYNVFLPIDALRSHFQGAGFSNVDIVSFPIPHDLEDCFMAAAWQRPYMYLDPEVRRSASGFALANPSEVEDGLKRLAQDLTDGAWREEYPEVLEQTSADWGYRFVKVYAKSPK